MWTPKNPVYLLRSCEKDFTSYNGFRWPELQGFAETPIYVKCDDWDSTPNCSGGLHGYVEGKGSGNQLKRGGFWQIIETEASEIVYIEDKAKVPQCHLIFCGSQKDATDFLLKQGYSHPIIGAFVTDEKFASAGNYGTATAGNEGTATAGYGGTATAGDWGTATAGDWGTAVAGYVGTATAGNEGTATAGQYGKASAGEGGIIEIFYWKDRLRKKIGYIGEDLKPNVFYRLDENFEFEEVIN